jgi:hypothetical protein
MNTFPAPASRITISARVAEWRRSRNDFHQADLPFSRVEVRTETARWFWQP